jgi:hypothetical protein
MAMVTGKRKRRHPALVTADRLEYDLHCWPGWFDSAERDMIDIIVARLKQIAGGVDNEPPGE